MNDKLPIGVLDSGRGGKSVLMALRRIMPLETYIYLADCKNAPYGNKSADEILSYTLYNTELLMRYPCKAIVIACNTATAVAVTAVREKYKEIPVIGLEPAIRPAIRDFPGKNILVLATPVTLKEKRFLNLLSGFPEEKRCGVIALPVQKLVSFVEEGMENSDELISYLKNELRPYKKLHFSACVLGCTHFPFAKNSIVRALGYRPVFYDGGEGAAKRLRLLLERRGELNFCEKNGFTLELNTSNNK